MTKSVIPNFKKWTIDERRLLVILLLTLMYPVFVTSFYALYLFVILPSVLSPSNSFSQAHHDGWYHIYWLFVALFWVFLCALILPCFKKKKVQHMINLGNVESPPYGTTVHPQPVIKVEVREEEDSQSNLSRRSENSSGNIKKGTDLESEKESLGKSRESLKKSRTSLERKKLTQSGEFLNDFMSTLHSEEAKKNETECEIHAEIHAAESEDQDKTRSDSDQELTDRERDRQSDKMGKEEAATEEETGKEEGRAHTQGPSDKNKNEHLSKDTDSSSESSSSEENAEPIVSAQKAKQPQASSPMKINEATVEQHGDRGEHITEELDKLDSDVAEVRQRKALPTIDTSRASDCYECSMPTPKSVEKTSSQNNTVFLYVNPDAAATEENILVCHGGEVEESEVKETKP